MAGYSNTPLARKLGIKDGSEVASSGRPAHLLALLPQLVLTDGECDVFVGFVDTHAALQALLADAPPRIRTAGGLWVAWPKKSSALPSEIDREDVRAAGLDTGWVDNKVCAIDSDWSGLRFVRRVRDR